MKIGDQILYTPEIITVTKGVPEKCEIIAIGIDGSLRVVFLDDREEKIESRLCEKD